MFSFNFELIIGPGKVYNFFEKNRPIRSAYIPLMISGIEQWAINDHMNDIQPLVAYAFMGGNGKLIRLSTFITDNEAREFKQ